MEDVSFTIKGDGLSEAEFNKRIAVTLDIKGPSPEDVIRTDYGDLILDPAFSGKLYVKELRLLQNKSRNKGYQYGYNLLSGRVNRDWESMAGPSEESKLLTGIWTDAIGAEGDRMIEKYVSLFVNHPTSCDVKSVKKWIQEGTAKVTTHREDDCRDHSEDHICASDG